MRLLVKLAAGLVAVILISSTDAVVAGAATSRPSGFATASQPAPPAPANLSARPWLRPLKDSRQKTGSASTSLQATPSVGGVWSWQHPRPEGNPLFAISCPTASTCFAAGDDSPILTTSNGGTSWSQHVRAFGITGLSCVSTTTCVGVNVVGSVISTVDGGSSWSARAVNPGKFLASVSCVTATTVCVAVGQAGSIFYSVDNGSTWNPQTSGTTKDLFGISCPATTTCYAVGDGPTFAKTTNGGQNWSLYQPNLATPIALYAVSCATLSDCTAVGQSAATYVTTNGGLDNWPSATGAGTSASFTGVSCTAASQCLITATDGFVYSRPTATTWSHGSVGELGSLFGISCPSATSCYVDGDYGVVAATTSGGTAWSNQSVLAAGRDLNAISCPTTATCFAVGNGGEIVATTNGGTTWTAQSSGTVYILTAITCLSATQCFAGGSSTLLGTTDGGATWTPQGLPGSNWYVSIACVSTTTCYVATNTASVFKTTNGGATWSGPSPVGTASSVTALACPTASICFATDIEPPQNGRVYGTMDGGATWAVSFDPANDPNAGINAPFYAIACPSATTCFAVGGSGEIAATTDGGANWRTDNSPSGATLAGVSCPIVNTCYAAAGDSTILHTADNGGTWDVQMGSYRYNGISCPSSTTCLAAGSSPTSTGAVSTTTNGGVAWSRQQPSGSITSVHAISCPTALTCIAVAFGTILTTHDGGVSWSEQTLTTTDELDDISCLDVNTCYAVGWPGAIYFTGNGGTSWTSQANSLYGSDQTLLGISCWTTTSCVVVGTGGTVLSTSNGSTWTSESSGTTQFLFGVSCPTSALCVAAGTNGAVLTRSGGAWQAQSSGTTKYLSRVACPTAAACYAAGQGGTVLKGSAGGTSWVPETSGTTQNLFGLACVNPTDCVADGSSGVVVATSDGTGWTDHSTPTLNSLYAVAAPDQNHVWAGGAGGTILESTLPPAVAVLPAMANAAYGGYTTVTEITNVGASQANITIGYVDSNGSSVGPGDFVADLPPNATWTVRQDDGRGLPAGGSGSAVIYSTQPVASFVNEFAPGGGDATSYTGIDISSGTGTTLYAPAIARNAYGGYTTGIGLINVSAAPADVTVTYRDTNGNTVKTQTLSGVAAGAYQGLYSGDAALALPDGFAGTATITSSAGPLAAIVNETGPGGQLSSYDAVPAGATTLFAPAALDNAYNGYNTGMAIVDTTGVAGVVTITYYDSGGHATVVSHNIAANGYLGIYQPNDLTAQGPYTAKLVSTVAIAAIVNETAPSSTAAKQSTSYNTFPTGTATLHLPLVESAGADGWSTGEGIMNTGAATTTVTVTYYDTITGAVIGTPASASLAPNAYWGLYQPAGGLPSGARASAVVTAGGGQVAVICNESSSTSFMSYDGQ